MKVLAFNGSPRKNGNTAAMLTHALKGAESEGAAIALIHLYDLKYTGCISCFACKLKDEKSYGRCRVKDDLYPVFEKIEQADALIFGSPIYFGQVSGMMHSFLERLFFQYMEYKQGYPSTFKRRIKPAFIYTMNVNADIMKKMGYELFLKKFESVAERTFGSSCQTLAANDTFQFDDYSRFVNTVAHPEEKARIKREIFPQDCQKAFELGKSIAQDNKIVI